MTRVAIIDGAARAFARKGFEAATMADIAGESGYSAPTLYNYFENKEAIIEALFEHLFAGHVALLDEPLPEGLSFVQKLEILLLRRVEFEHRNRDALALLMQPPTGKNPKLAATMMMKLAELMTRYAAWIRDSATPEELHGRDPTDLAFLLWGVSHSMEMRYRMQPGLAAATPAEQTKLILDFFLHGLVGCSSSEPK